MRPDAFFFRANLEDRIYGWYVGVESNAVEFLTNSLDKKQGIAVTKNVKGTG